MVYDITEVYEALHDKDNFKPEHETYRKCTGDTRMFEFVADVGEVDKVNPSKIMKKIAWEMDTSRWTLWCIFKDSNYETYVQIGAIFSP